MGLSHAGGSGKNTTPMSLTQHTVEWFDRYIINLFQWIIFYSILSYRRMVCVAPSDNVLKPIPPFCLGLQLACYATLPNAKRPTQIIPFVHCATPKYPFHVQVTSGTRDRPRQGEHAEAKEREWRCRMGCAVAVALEKNQRRQSSGQIHWPPHRMHQRADPFLRPARSGRSESAPNCTA